jgi:enoyl-CoA hydratase/carnithine racemase
MAMTGDSIYAANSFYWGLINKDFAPDQLEAATRDLIERATRGSALSKALGKQAFYRQVDLPQDEAYDFAVERMATASLLPDAQEGIAAFLDKRPARYMERPGPNEPA